MTSSTEDKYFVFDSENEDIYEYKTLEEVENFIWERGDLSAIQVIKGKALTIKLSLISTDDKENNELTNTVQEGQE